MGIKETLTLAINLAGSAHFDGEEARELLARLTAADALAEAVSHLLRTLDTTKEPMLYNQSEAQDLVSAALRQYREAAK